MPQAQNGPVSIHWDERGQGDPLVLIMGYAARSAHWGEEFRDLLARRFRVISLDNRGTGDSDKPADDWTMQDMADDVLAVMDAASLQDAHIAGISMGGMVAQQIALSHPERLRTLTLISTHPGGPEAVQPTEAATAVLINPDRSQPVEQIVENVYRVICAPGFLDEPGRAQACVRLDLDKPTPVAMLGKQMKAITGSDRSGRLGEIKAPTLIITGTGDPLVPPGNSDLLHRLIHGSRLERIPACGHMPCLEKPGELASLITEFLAATSA
jgi:pimeloyl-ACP methyl ester carboxylesterase